jgi:small subunit ribosomal protein S6
MRDYESIIIFKPDLEEEQFEQNLAKIEKVLQKQKAEIIELQKWGVRSLAYEIKKYNQGNYVLLHFRCTPPAIVPIEQHYKLDEQIIRFLTVSIKPGELQKDEKPELLPEKEI